MYDTGIADRIRAKAAQWNMPVDVIEVDGWRTRGREWPRRPILAVGHHTGNRNTGWAPSLNICIHGRADLSGPLCQCLRARKRDGRYTVFVIAAGVANHAGKGGYGGFTGNSTCYGLEVENVGTTVEPWTDEDQQIDAMILAAMLDGVGHGACEHKEWAPTRKIDRHTLSGDHTRKLVLKYLGAPPAPEPIPPTPEPVEDDYPVDFFIIKDTNGSAIFQWFPELGPQDENGRKIIFAEGVDVTQARQSRRYCGDLEWTKPDLDGVPNMSGG